VFITFSNLEGAGQICGSRAVWMAFRQCDLARVALLSSGLLPKRMKFRQRLEDILKSVKNDPELIRVLG